MGATEAKSSKETKLKQRATVIYRRDDQILFVRKRHSKWNLPGGRVEPGETPHQAALREMAEETGLAVDRLIYIAKYRHDNVVHFLFEARLVLAKKPRPLNEIEDCCWLSAKQASKRKVRRPVRTMLKRCVASPHRRARTH